MFNGSGSTTFVSYQRRGVIEEAKVQCLSKTLRFGVKEDRRKGGAEMKELHGVVESKPKSFHSSFQMGRLHFESEGPRASAIPPPFQRRFWCLHAAAT